MRFFWFNQLGDILHKCSLVNFPAIGGFLLFMPVFNVLIGFVTLGQELVNHCN